MAAGRILTFSEAAMRPRFREATHTRALSVSSGSFGAGAITFLVNLVTEPTSIGYLRRWWTFPLGNKFRLEIHTHVASRSMDHCGAGGPMHLDNWARARLPRSQFLPALDVIQTGYVSELETITAAQSKPQERCGVGGRVPITEMDPRPEAATIPPPRWAPQ